MKAWNRIFKQSELLNNIYRIVEFLLYDSSSLNAAYLKKSHKNLHLSVIYLVVLSKVIQTSEDLNFRVVLSFVLISISMSCTLLLYSKMTPNKKFVQNMSQKLALVKKQLLVAHLNYY